MSFTLEIEPGGRDHMCYPCMPSLALPISTANCQSQSQGREAWGLPSFTTTSLHSG